MWVLNASARPRRSTRFPGTRTHLRIRVTLWGLTTSSRWSMFGLQSIINPPAPRSWRPRTSTPSSLAFQAATPAAPGTTATPWPPGTTRTSASSCRSSRHPAPTASASPCRGRPTPRAPGTCTYTYIVYMCLVRARIHTPPYLSPLSHEHNKPQQILHLFVQERGTKADYRNVLPRMKP